MNSDLVPVCSGLGTPWGRRSLPDGFAGAVTGIGSLPFTSTVQAIRALTEHCPEVPFWPQLPKLSDREVAVRQALGVLRDLIGPRAGRYGYQVKEGLIEAVVSTLHSTAVRLTPANAAGFSAFEEALGQGAFGSAVAVKGQIEGPLTLGTYLFHRDRPFLADTSLFDALAFHVRQIVSWQIDRLKIFGRPVLIFIDEPALCMNDTLSTGLAEERQLSALCGLLDDVRAQGAVAGLHCCASRPFARMCAAKPDILSFDAHEGLEQFFADPHSLRFVGEGGWVAYGIVPTAGISEAVPPGLMFDRWLRAASGAGDPQALAYRAIITSSCGLGLLHPAAVTQSFQIAREVGGRIRQFAGLELTCDPKTVPAKT